MSGTHKPESDEAQNALEGRLKAEIEGVLERIREGSESDAVTLLIYDPEEERFCSSFAIGLLDRRTFDYKPPQMDRVAGKGLKARKPLRVDQVRGHPDMDGAFARRERIESATGFPVLQEDAPIGVLFVSYRRRYVLGREKAEAIEVILRDIVALVKQPDNRNLLNKPHMAPLDEMTQVLDSIIQFGYSLTQRPISFWLLERPDHHLRIRASTGLTREYVEKGVAQLKPAMQPNVIRQVVETSRSVEIRDIVTDERFRYPDLAERAGWSSLLALPVEVHGQIRGVIELFTFDREELDEINQQSLRYLTKMASVTLENTYRARESRELAEVARNLSQKPDFDRAMKLIVGSARRLTGADSSTIILLEKRTGSFIVGVREPHDNPVVRPRSRGLTHEIIDSESGVARIDDNSKDRRVNQELKDGGFSSMIGVRIQIEQEQIGVLYVDGLLPGQFTSYDEQLLHTLADYASVALGWAQMLLRPSRAIEVATADLYQLDARLDEFCGDLMGLGFDFSAIQLIRPEERIIEMVYGVNAAGTPARIGSSSHYLHEDEDLRDIQADIALASPPRAEVLRGWDERFDRGIFNELRHNEVVRIYMPLFIVHDARGELATHWSEDCHWTVQGEEESVTGRRTILGMEDPAPDLTLEVIGTVEAGFADSTKPISLELANKMSRLVARRATGLRRPSLQTVLEVIVEQARQLVRADSATLHFPYEPGQPYEYQVQAGKIPSNFLRDYPPRSQGVGSEAMQCNEPRFVPDPSRGHEKDELRSSNPEVWGKGIKTMAAFPLLVGNKKGLLYAHIHRHHTFREHEIGWVRLFANRAADAIRHVLTYTQIRDRARQLATLQSIAQSLGRDPEDSNLLGKIAGNTLNLFAADVVTIYEYRKREGRVLDPPSIAGRLKHERSMNTAIRPEDAPLRLLAHGSNVYVPKSSDTPEEVGQNPILNNPERRRDGQGFVDRERIRSAAAILLRARDGIVGMMFINYRRPHRFPKEEKAIIDALASSAAIAIKNRRVLERRQQDLVIMTHQLQAPLVAVISHLSAIEAPQMRAKDRLILESARALAEDALALCHGTCTAFARDAGSKLAFNQAHLDVAGELAALSRRLKTTNFRADLEFRIRVEPGLPRLETNREIFSSVMFSLIHNSMKYSEQDSVVHIDCVPTELPGSMLVKIGTTGEPIDPADREVIFERFRRGKIFERTGRHYQGVGIGLWAARQLMLAIGGSITLELVPESPRFSEFTVRFPRHLPDKQASAE